MFLFGFLVGVAACYVFFSTRDKRAGLGVCCLSVDIESEECVSELERLVESFRLNVLKKQFTRENGMQFDLTFKAHPMVQHVFLKRLYALEGLGRIIKL